MEKPLPDFAIFQNDRTKVSALWIKEVGEWRECPPRDYETLQVITAILRNSPDPEHTLVMIANLITKMNKE